MEIVYYVTSLFFVLIFCCTTILHLKFKKRQSYILQFEHYVGVLEYYLDKAYTIVYKDKILVYSVDGSRPSDDEFNQATKEFCNIVLKLLGEELLKEFYFIYGNPDNFVFALAEYFHSKSEEDEIREQAINNMMEKET